MIFLILVCTIFTLLTEKSLQKLFMVSIFGFSSKQATLNSTAKIFMIDFCNSFYCKRYSWLISAIAFLFLVLYARAQGLKLLQPRTILAEMRLWEHISPEKTDKPLQPQMGWPLILPCKRFASRLRLGQIVVFTLRNFKELLTKWSILVKKKLETNSQNFFHLYCSQLKVWTKIRSVRWFWPECWFEESLLYVAIMCQTTDATKTLLQCQRVCMTRLQKERFVSSCVNGLGAEQWLVARQATLPY